MYRTASQASSIGLPPSSPGTSAPLEQQLKSTLFDIREPCVVQRNHLSSLMWAFKHFQWILVVYATGVLLATSIASRKVYELGEHFKDIMETLELDSSSKRLIDQVVSVSLLISWLLAGGAIIDSVMSILWKLLNAAKRERFKHLAKEGEITIRTAGMCIRFNALNMLLNTVHVFCMLTCIWFVVMLCGLVALLVLLIVGRKSADGALDFIQVAERWLEVLQDANSLAADIFVRIQEYKKKTIEISSTINSYCAQYPCPYAIATTQDSLEELSNEMAGLLVAVDDAQAGGCVCASATIEEVSKFVDTAKGGCRSACIAILVAFLCALLMLSKTAMNLKSHVKDDAWMRRVRRIFLKLQERGIRLPSNEPGTSSFDGGTFKSMAFMNDVYNAALPPVDTQSNDSRNGTPRGMSPSKLMSQLQRGISNRNYLGIEPPVSLGSDVGGSGPLHSLSSSRRLPKLATESSLGASSGGLGVYAVTPTALIRDSSVASSSSGNVGLFAAAPSLSGSYMGLQPLATAQKQRGKKEGGRKGKRTCLQSGLSVSGRVKRSRFETTGGEGGKGGFRELADPRSNRGSWGGVRSPRSPGWVPAGVRSMLSCIDGVVQKHGEDEGGDPGSHNMSNARGITTVSSAPCVLMHEDVASGVTVMPPQLAPAVATGGFVPQELPLGSLEDSSAFSRPPEATPVAFTAVGGLSGAGVGVTPIEFGVMKQQGLGGSGGVETPPPVANTELSVIHEMARESSITLPSTYDTSHVRHASASSWGTPEVARSARPSSGGVSSVGVSEIVVASLNVLDAPA